MRIPYLLVILCVSPALWITSATSLTQLTDNSVGDFGAAISGNGVVWESARNLHYWDGQSLNVFETTSQNALYPDIDNSNIVWSASYDIYFWNGTTTNNITANGNLNLEPAISGSNVVWRGHDGNDWEIYLWNGSSTIQLTNNEINDWEPDVSGSNVVWYNENSEVMLWDGSQISVLSMGRSPAIYGSQIAWAGDDGMYYWDGADTHRLTDHGGIGPAISEGGIVWYERQASPDSLDIMYYEFGGEVMRATETRADDLAPDISGSTVVWEMWDGEDFEIVLEDASRFPVVPEPSTGTLFSLGIAGFGFRRRLGRRNWKLF